MTPNSNI